MRTSRVLSRIRSGRCARICACGHYLPLFPRFAAHAGYDGIWVDAEHRCFDPREIQALLTCHHLAGIDCLWRASTLEPSGLYRLLEDGATGLIIPLVSTPQAARQLVEAVRFPPLGNRGLDGSGLDADFGIGTPGDFCERANRETCLIVQIETPQALENAEAIAATQGVDALFMGPADLSLRLGIACDPREPRFQAAQAAIARAAQRSQKAWGRPALSIEDAKDLHEAGAQLINWGCDYHALLQHLQTSGAQLSSIVDGVPDRPGQKLERAGSSAAVV